MGGVPGGGTDVSNLDSLLLPSGSAPTSKYFSAGGGMLDKLGGMFSNKLFMQLLGSAGADLLGRTGGKNTLATLTQNIASKNYAGLLQHILGGGHPGAKMTADSDGMKLSLPNVPGQGDGGEGAGGGGGSPAPGIVSGGNASGAANPTIGGDMTGYMNKLIGSLNPFDPSQLNFSASDLAGLDPQMLTQALQLKLQGGELQERTLRDIAESGLKEREFADLQAYRKGELANTQELRDIESDKNYLEWYKAATKDERTELQKDYAFAQSPEGGGFKGTVMDFKNYSDTGDWKNYQHYVNEEKGAKRIPESFDKWMSRHEASKATKVTLGEKLEEKAALSKLQGSDYFDNPSWTKDIDKSLNGKQAQDDIYNDVQKLLKSGEAKNSIEAGTIASRNKKIEIIEDKIKAGGGKVSGYKLASDGKTVIWSVDWPDITDSNGKVVKKGTKGTISYAVQ